MTETWCEEQAGGQNANCPAPPVLARPAKTSGLFSCDKVFFLSLITPSLSPESTMSLFLRDALERGTCSQPRNLYLSGIFKRTF